MIHHVNMAAIKLIAALLLGSVIGLEREISDKAAGLRTNILICLGACLFTILSEFFTNDPARISAQLVSGIGFLGAGAIMREGDKVTGLTTAATIWMVAAIGMAVGYGHFALGVTATLIALFVQLVFTQLDIWIDNWRERYTFRIVSKMDDQALTEIESVFVEAKLRVMRRKLMKKNSLYYSEWYTTGGRVNQSTAQKRLLSSPAVLEVTY